MNKPDFQLTHDLVNRVIETVDAGLSSGLGKNKPGMMCVEAAVCYAMGLPHGDNPPCVHPAIRAVKIRLNDSNWSGKQARAIGMRRLAVLQLGTADCGFDASMFAKKLALFTIKTILPMALTAAGLHNHAAACSAVVTLPDAAYAAARAAADAASAARAAASAARAAASAARAAASAARAVADAAYAVADAAAYAAYAVADAADAADAAAYAAYAVADAAYAVADAAAYAAYDEVLGKFAMGVEDILIEMKVPAVEFLALLDKNPSG